MIPMESQQVCTGDIPQMCFCGSRVSKDLNSPVPSAFDCYDLTILFVDGETEQNMQNNNQNRNNSQNGQSQNKQNQNSRNQQNQNHFQNNQNNQNTQNNQNQNTQNN